MFATVIFFLGGGQASRKGANVSHQRQLPPDDARERSADSLEDGPVCCRTARSRWAFARRIRHNDSLRACVLKMPLLLMVAAVWCGC